MIKYLLSLSLSLAAGMFTASGLTITTQGPGTVADQLGSSAAILTLTVNGEIDASDMAYIESLPGLLNLDLSGAKIVAYSGKSINGMTSYPANTIPNGMFAKTSLTTVVLPTTSGLNVGDGAFAGSKLQNITVSTPGVILGSGAFSGCPDLKTANISASSLPEHLFAESTSLEEVTLTGATQIPASAFAGCTKLHTVNGTAAITSIGDNAFNGCSDLETFSFGSSLQAIGKSAFASSGLESADMSNSTSLSSIGPWAFSECQALSEVIIPSSVKNLGEGVFFDCPQLKNITTSNKIELLPAYSFTGDTSLPLEEVFTDGITRVGDYAFKGLSQTSEIAVPSTVEFLGNGAMEDMTGLTKISVYELTTVPELGIDVWAGVDQENVELYVLPEMSDEFGAADQWQNFKFMIDTGIGEVLTPDSDIDKKVEGRFVGTDLQVRASLEISKVDIYLPSGMLALSVRPGATTALIPTGDIDGKIFIVECTLSDNSRAAIKLLRR